MAAGRKQLTYTVAAPGSWGLNTQNTGINLDYRWALTALNAIVDDSGRLAAREGWTSVATYPTNNVNPTRLHEYIDSATGASITITATNNGKLYDGTASFTEKTGTISSPTAYNWKFVNFNGKVLGFQAGHTPITKTGSGNWADLTASSGTVPTGNEALAAFGRIWAVSGNTTRSTLKWCAVLDATHWTTGAGSLDFNYVWGSGADEIVALASFQGRLIVFGKQHICMFRDATGDIGSGGGIYDPAAMYLEDMIKGIGCVARDSVQDIGTDILFLSGDGIRSLGRTIQNETAPLLNVSKNVAERISNFTAGETASGIRSAYDRRRGWYLLNLPSSARTICVHLRHFTGEGDPVITEWDLTAADWLPHTNGTLYLALANSDASNPADLGMYSGYTDGTGVTYSFEYESGWNDGGAQLSNREKILKKIIAIYEGGYAYSPTISWGFDYLPTSTTVTQATQNISTTSGEVAEFGVAEFGVAEFGPEGTYYTKNNVNALKSGKTIQLGITATINNKSFSIQKMDLIYLIGRQN